MRGDLLGEGTVATFKCDKMIIAVRCGKNEYDHVNVDKWHGHMMTKMTDLDHGGPW